MKKLSLISLLLVFWSAFCFGKEVPASTAKTVGYHFLLQKGAATVKTADDLKLIYAPGNGQPSFYVFGTESSFVIVAGDDAVEPVLGYATDNTFNPGKMPAQISSFLDGYAEQMNEVVAAHAVANAATEAKWNNLVQNKASGTAAKTTAVTPLMSTRWNQSPYYNADCPYDFAGGARSVTGCVATAMAQVMKFWSWPTNGTGMHSYSSSCCGTLSANFGSTTYNWASMPNTVSSPNAAVAKIMSHVGISVDMNYSATSSGAYVVSSASPITHCTEYALRNYFNYKPTLSGVERSSYSETAWKMLLKTELDNGRPVIMAGYGSGGGHCFIADGYDASDFFHMNWGWGGSSDGYFSINALNPGTLGSGGGSGGYNSGQQAVIGVMPNTGVPTASLVMDDYVNISSTSIFYGSAFSVSTAVGNTGATAFTGKFCAAAFNSAGTFVSYIDSTVVASLPAGYTTGTMTFNTTGLLSMLPGTYTIGIFYKPTGGGWVAVGNSTWYNNFENMDVVNHNPMQMATAMTLAPTTFVQGAAASVTFNLINEDFADYTGSYNLALFNMDGTFSSNIQTMTGMSLPSGFTYTTPLTFSTTSITSPPGSYLLAVRYVIGSTWYLCGTDYFLNPIIVNIAAPPPPPDMYEVNNTAATAYNLPLTFVADVATKSTPGSNIHVNTDNDYYKVVLPAGYNYTINARVNDQLSADDAGSYSVDVVWSYSLDNGTTWSSVYSDVMSGTIDLTGYTGGTVIFRVSPSFAGNLGNYILKLGSITRSGTSSIPTVNLGTASVFPNPATDMITVDLSATGAHGISATLKDIQGKTVYATDAANQSVMTIPVKTLSTGIYILQVTTDAGILTRKIAVSN